MASFINFTMIGLLMLLTNQCSTSNITNLNIEFEEILTQHMFAISDKLPEATSSGLILKISIKLFHDYYNNGDTASYTDAETNAIGDYAIRYLKAYKESIFVLSKPPFPFPKELKNIDNLYIKYHKCVFINECDNLLENNITNKNALAEYLSSQVINSLQNYINKTNNPFAVLNKLITSFKNKCDKQLKLSTVIIFEYYKMIAFTMSKGFSMIMASYMTSYRQSVNSSRSITPILCERHECLLKATQELRHFDLRNKLINKTQKYFQNFSDECLSQQVLLKGVDYEEVCDANDNSTECIRSININPVEVTPGYWMTGFRWETIDQELYLELQEGIYNKTEKKMESVRWITAIKNNNSILIENLNNGFFNLASSSLPFKYFATGVKFNVSDESTITIFVTGKEFMGNDTVEVGPESYDNTWDQDTIPSIDIRDVVTSSSVPISGIKAHSKIVDGLDFVEINILTETDLEIKVLELDESIFDDITEMYDQLNEVSKKFKTNKIN